MFLKGLFLFKPRPDWSPLGVKFPTSIPVCFIWESPRGGRQLCKRTFLAKENPEQKRDFHADNREKKFPGGEFLLDASEFLIVLRDWPHQKIYLSRKVSQSPNEAEDRSRGIKTVVLFNLQCDSAFRRLLNVNEFSASSLNFQWSL